MNKEKIQKAIAAIENEVGEYVPNFLDEYPVGFTVREIQSYSDLYNYDHIGKKLRRVYESIRKKYDTHVLSLYHRLTLAHLIREALERLEKQDLPDDIHSLYHDWFERVVSDLSKQPDESFDFRNDAFLKDLGVCSLMAIPVGGAWIVEVARSRNRSLETGKLHDRPGFIGNVIKTVGLNTALRFILSTFSRLDSFYVIHTVNRYMLRFTAEEMDGAYRRIALLLTKNPHIKGLFRKAWFLDPQLEKISPELAYVRRVPEQGGARIFPANTKPFDIENALVLSRTRRKLYDDGKYMPQSYAMFWPREKLILWSKGRVENKI